MFPLIVAAQQYNTSWLNVGTKVHYVRIYFGITNVLQKRSDERFSF